MLNKTDSKIIGVGFHKTGISTLLTSLKILGFNAAKGKQPYTRKLTPESERKVLEDKDYAKLLSYIEPFDAIVDNPWNILFKEIDKQFPNSKFIFTYRKKLEWLESAKKYFQHRPDTTIRRWVYSVDTCDEITDEIYLRRYERHNEEVLTYFKGREKDFLQMNIMEGDGWEKLCPFLDKPVLKLPFPKQNTNLIK